jgi:hypothetical protein
VVLSVQDFAPLEMVFIILLQQLVLFEYMSVSELS